MLCLGIRNMEKENMEKKKNPSNPPADKKKGFPTYVIVIIVVVVVIFGGVFYAANLVKSKIASVVPYNIDTKNQTFKTKVGNVDTVVSEKEVAWPGDIPGDVPKFQGGKIKAVTHDKTSDTWGIVISDSTQLEFNNYKIYLQNAGWKLGDQADVLVNITTMTKGDRQISLVFDSSSKGVIITLTTVK
jgi:hypothetical protein